jgi:D-sedoheptulose 7-phosphate isomerase
MNTYMDKFINAFNNALLGVQITDSDGNSLDKEVALEELCDLSKTCQKEGKTQYFCGNGASAAFASHMALDWSKNGGVRSEAFNDPVLFTALGNDVSIEAIFARSLKMYASQKDMLITISSSGNSPNIIQAIKVARSMKMRVVTLSGLKPDNVSRKSGDLNLFVPAKTYGVVESAHQVLLHIWLDSFMNLQEWNITDFQNMREK